jgi:hypothetical protein
MSHWAQVQVDTTGRVWVVIDWEEGQGVVNDTARPFDIYMDLEITHSRRLLSDQSVVRTLPGTNRFTTERDRALIIFTHAPIGTVQPGTVMGIPATVVVDRRAFPNEGLEVKAIVRLVENPQASEPGDVGRVILEHRQDGVLRVNSI